MTISYWQRANNQGIEQVTTRVYDICIVGAGITGASVAWWLRCEAPQLRVAVVERGAVGSGASGRNAGMVLAGLADHYDKMIEQYGRSRAGEIWEATLAHARLLKQFAEETRADIGYQLTGSWRTGMEPAEREHLARSAELLYEDGFAARYTSDDPLGRGFYGALGIDSDATIHPLRLVQSLLEASAADVYEHHETYAVVAEGDALRVRTVKGDFVVGKVCLALNAYAPLFDYRLAKYVEPHRGQILVTAPLAAKILPRPVYTHHGYVYFRQLTDNRLLLGGWRHEFAQAEAGYADAISAEVQNALLNFKDKYFPEASGVPLEGQWAGTMGFSPDGLPIIGTLSATDGNALIKQNDSGGRSDEPEDNNRIHYVIGFTGHGFGLALEVARRAVLSILHDQPGGIFDVRRIVQESETRTK